MKTLVCYFSGWFEIDVNDVDLIDAETGVIKTASEFLSKRGNVDGLMLHSFDEAHANATDGEFTDISLEIEET